MPANLENSLQSQRKAIPKNAQLPHNCTHITRQQSNAQNSPSQASTVVNHELSDIQAGFRKGRGSRDQIANIHWIIEKAREFQKNICCGFIDYAKAFDFVNQNKLWKFLNRWEYQTTWHTSWETCMQVKKQQLELDMEQQTGSKSGRSMSSLYIVTLLI